MTDVGVLGMNRSRGFPNKGNQIGDGLFGGHSISRSLLRSSKLFKSKKEESGQPPCKSGPKRNDNHIRQPPRFGLVLSSSAAGIPSGLPNASHFNPVERLLSRWNPLRAWLFPCSTPPKTHKPVVLFSCRWSPCTPLWASRVFLLLGVHPTRSRFPNLGKWNQRLKPAYP